jgi:opacity protein-like surface antigen
MKKLFLIVSFFFVFSASSFAQLRPDLLPFELPGLDLNFSGAGVAARGMSGAFTGVSGNLSAIGFNPAGLSTLDRPQAVLVYRYNRPTFRNQQFSPVSSASLDRREVTTLDQVDFGGLALPGKLFGRSFVGAFAYSVLSDQFFSDRLNTPVSIPLSTFDENDTATQVTGTDLARRVTGKLSAFNIGAATRVGPFSFGATFLIYQGGFSDTTEQIVGPLFLRPSNGVDSAHILPAFDRQRLANEVEYRGSSVLLGAQADYKNFRLGFSARIPSFTLGETDLFRLKSNLDIGFYDSFFVSGLYQANQSQENRLFLTDTRLELPLSLSAGLAYRLGQPFLVDFDYTYTNWGAADLKVRRIFYAPFSNPATLELGSGAVGLTSSHQFRLGGELELNPGFGQIFVRGGVRTLPVRTLTSLLPLVFDTAYQDSFVRDAQGNVIDTISTVVLQYTNGNEGRRAAGKFWQHFGASLGVGVRWNQIALDLSYDYSTFRRASRTLTPLEGMLTTYRQQRQHRLFVGFTGYFTRI